MPRKSNSGVPRVIPSPIPTPSSAYKSTSRSSRRHHADTALPSSPDPLAPSPIATTRPRKRPKKQGDDVEISQDPASGLGAVIEPEGEGTDEATLEKQLEAWQEFAADHYEMVEQLPLELHRNFRLLRELDDGCVAQTSKLQEQIRAYIGARMELVKRYAAVAGAMQEVDIPEGEMEVDAADGAAPVERAPEQASESGQAGEEQSVEAETGLVPAEEGGGAEKEGDARAEAEEGMEIDPQPDGVPANNGEAIINDPAPDAAASPPNPTPAAHTTDLDSPAIAPATLASPPAAPPMPDLPPDMGELVPDGEGGLVVASSNAPAASTAAPEASVHEGGASTSGLGNQTEDVEAAVPSGAEAVDPSATEAATEATPEQPAAGPQGVAPAIDIPSTTTSSSLELPPLPSRLLPEIGRLAREVVRNCEEKVALAVGAYNSIDRHIRALDSALSAQETSLILGLRPDTLPSAGVDQTLNLAGDTSGIPANGDDGEGGMVLGVGGGGASRKRKGKKGKKRAETEEAMQQGIVAEVKPREPELENVDPNEPTYCYCNKVSYGTMIGCDNDDCPLEWFHLPCTGLQAEPPGSWMCSLCKPKIGLGMGGAGAVQPGGVEKKAGKKKRRA